MTLLVPCDTCERHIRSSEEACPFCGAAATPFEVSAQEAAARPLRVSRTALVLASLTALSACGKKPVESPDPPETTVPDAAPTQASTFVPMPPYGMPPPAPFDAGPGPGPGVSAKHRTPRPPYGQPPHDGGGFNLD